MKKITIIFIALILFCLSSSLSAQNIIGFRGGFQTGNLYSSGSLYKTGLNTFYVGVFKEFKIATAIKFDAGIDFNQNGALNDSLSINLSYISVPLNFNIKIGPVYGILGAAASFKIDEKWTYNDQEVNIDNLKSNFFNVPVFLGVGYKLSFIAFEARYYVGTMSINDNAISVLKDYRNQYLQLGLALSIL